MKEKEIIEKRKEREKHFLREDGSIVAKVYNEKIHYIKNGKYEEIDNTLVNKKDYYVNKSNNFKTIFNKNVKNKLLRIEKDKYFIEFGLNNCNNGILEKAKKDNSEKLFDAVKYKNVLDNVDIDYKVIATKTKETIVLKKKRKDLKEFNFNINTNVSLLLKNGEIIAFDNDKLIFKVERPYMMDSNSNISDNVSYSLEKVSTGYMLKVILDEEWLMDSNRVYPVYIDPSIECDVDNVVKDTYIYPNDSANKGSYPYLKAGVERVNEKDIVNRALVKFDLPELGTSSEIINAELRLAGYLRDDNDENLNKIVEIYRVTNNWTKDSATWANMHDKYDSSRVEAIYSAQRSYAIGEELYPVFGLGVCTITGLVKKWYEDKDNYGIMLKSAKEEYIDNNFPMFFSSENTINDVLGPKLILTYRDNNGLESCFNYNSQSLSIGSMNVNSYNGNLVGIFEVGRTIGGKLPVSVGLVYNTNDVVLNKGDIFGKGFRFNLDETIKEIDKDTLEYTDKDGTVHFFNKDSNGNYFDEDGLDLISYKENDDYIIKDKNGNFNFYLKSGDIYYLASSKDVAGNMINITRNSNNLVTKIVDSSEKEINIIYGVDSIEFVSPDLTTSVKLSDGKVNEIETVYGSLLLSYNSNNLIELVTDINGLKYSYNYYEKSPYKVKAVKQLGLDNSSGESLEFIYGVNLTKIKDNKGRVNNILFNSFGNPVCSNVLKEDGTIEEAYSTSNIYGDDTTKNKIINKVVPVQYVNNYLKNTSFEEDEENFRCSNGMTKSLSNNLSYSGTNSLKISSTNNNEYIEQDVSVPKGKDYTFSGYFLNESDIRIELSYIDFNDEIVTAFEDIKPNLLFHRDFVTIHYKDDAKSSLNIKIYNKNSGTNYIDDIQLETGSVANHYNMIENSNFSLGVSDWQLQAMCDGEEISADSIFSVVNIDDNNNKALKLKMKADTSCLYRKRIKINGKKGDVYNISFWFKNEGVEHILHDDAIFFGGTEVGLYFIPVDGDLEHCVAMSNPFTPNKDAWQYFSYEFTALEDYREIVVGFRQGGDANDFYITNLYLYKNMAKKDIDYDENGNILKIKDVSNRENNFKYDENNQLIKMISPKGSNFKYEYDNVVTDRVISTISPMGITNKFKYDTFGNVSTVKVANEYKENVSSGEYKIRCRGTDKYLDVVNNKVVVRSNTCSNTVWNIEKYNNTYKIKYSLTNLYFTYSNDKVLLSIGDNNNILEFISNDNGSFAIKKVNEDKYLKTSDDSVEFESLASGDYNFEFYFETVNEEFIESEAVYTEDGRFLKSVIDSNFNKTEYDIDSVKGLINSKTDPMGNVTTYNYNNKNQIASINVLNKTINYSYNINNLLTKISELNREYNLTYDNFLNLKKVAIGDNITLVENFYEANNGNLIKARYGNNQEISYEYDKFDRVNVKHLQDDDYKYVYDNNGNIAKVISSGHKRDYIYDNLKRIQEYKYDNFKISFDYNENDSITNIRYGLNNTAKDIINTYDANDVLIKTDNSDTDIDYIYDSLNRIKEKKINNSYTTKYSYLSLGKRTSNLVKSLENGNNKYSYKYDKLNNITDIYYNDELMIKYFYDQYNELIKEEDYFSGEITEYNYDSYGNILTKVVRNKETNSIISTDTYNYGNSDWQDQLTKFNDKNITYDLIGNPLTIGNDIILSWINGRTLNAYTNSSKNLNISYKYNQDGIREGKIVNGIETKYYLEGRNVIYEEKGNNVIYYLYDSTGVIGLEYNNDVYYYEKNIQNDVVGILNSNYEEVVKYKYDSFGKLLSVEDSNGNEIVDVNNIGIINPFRYRSYYYDTETGLYYLNSRYYNPVWGRFINADGIVGANQDILSYNLYAYCSNNPVINFDPNGHDALALPGVIGVIKKATEIAGAVAGAGSAAATAGLVGLAVAGAALFAKAIIENSGVSSKVGTISIPDVEPQKPMDDEKVYSPAYSENRESNLEILDTKLTLDEAKGMLLLPNAMEFKNNAFGEKLGGRIGPIYGIYTYDQAYAKQLALEISPFGFKRTPEYHGSGQYGHYHVDKKYHIWFGLPICEF